MDRLLQDLRFGVRMLIKSPGFSLVAVLSLVIGIGANTAVFSVLDALILRPLPYQDAERLVILWNRSPGLNIEQDWFSPGQYVDIRSQNQVFETTAVTIGASFNMTGTSSPERIDGARVSSSFFNLFEIGAMRGRVLAPDEDGPQASKTVVLSNRFWQRRFGSNPDAIGQSIRLNGEAYEIVGILPADFAFDRQVMPAVNAIRNADIFLPLPLSESAQAIRTNEDYNIFARLKPGVSVAQAQADMDVIAAGMIRRYPDVYPPHGRLTLSVVPLQEQVVGEMKELLWLLYATIGFVLLIACANISNLLLSRSAARRREMAVRSALGAGRARIVRQLLTECILLALVGGALGLVVAQFSIEALRIYGQEIIPRLSEISLNGRVLGYTLLLTVLTGVIFGIAPALRATGLDVNEVLKDGGRAGDSGRSRLSGLLVVTEIALALVLVIGAVLLIRSHQRLLRADRGYSTGNILSFRLAAPPNGYPKPESVVDFYRKTIDGIRALPGVVDAGISYSLPMSSVALAWEPIRIEGYVPKTTHERIISNARFVSPGFFNVMRIRLVRGRLFDDRDSRGAPETVIIDEAMARRFWPNSDPLGRRISRGEDDPWRTIVGVVSTTAKYSSEKEPPITVFYPAGQISPRSMFVVVRTASDPEAMAPSVLGVIRGIDPDLPPFDLKTMAGRVDESLARRRLAVDLLTIFALVAVTLAAIGIYGVISYRVEQQKHEIGIRMALGARPLKILGLVFSQSAVLIIAGIATGLAIAVMLSRIISSLLYDVSATDPAIFLGASVALAGIAFLAGIVPALRAIRVDPMISLRHQ